MTFNELLKMNSRFAWNVSTNKTSTSLKGRRNLIEWSRNFSGINYRHPVTKSGLDVYARDAVLSYKAHKTRNLQINPFSTPHHAGISKQEFKLLPIDSVKCIQSFISTMSQ